MDSKEIWTIEYCERQDNFHIDTLKKTVTENLRDLVAGKRLEWIIVGIAPSSQKALEFSENLRKKIGRKKHPKV